MQALFEAIAAGDLEQVRAIVQRDPAAASARGDDGLTAVLQARYRDRQDIVAVLLAAGPQLDVFDAAAVGDDGRLVELLEAESGLVNAWSMDGFTPLHLAVFFGHAAVAGLLIQRGADIHAVSRNRMTVMPLHSAVAGRDRDSVKALLEAGADVNAPSHAGL